MTRIAPPIKKTRKRQSSSPLPLILDKNLLAYAAAASAAGVALLACSVPAKAEVIATQVDIPIPINGGLIQFDINNDGKLDFGLSAFARSALGHETCSTTNARKNLGCPFNDQVRILPAQTGNEVVQHGSSYGAKCAAAFPLGAKIGTGRTFAMSTLVMAGHAGTSEGVEFCPWDRNVSRQRFLGVKFTDTSGQVHYGWVRVRVANITSATITAYGYETVPNQPILTGSTHGPVVAAVPPEPSYSIPAASDLASLGRLAQGASGLSAWRREQETAETKAQP